MPRNTLIVIIFLAIIAAIVAGVGLTRPKPSVSNTSTAEPSVSPSAATPKTIPYTSNGCGIILEYPETMNILEGPTGSVVFTGKTNSANVIIVTCQKNIPKPAISSDKTEQLASGSISATLYHDASAKDGTPIDKLIFRNPNNGLDIFISGYGKDFQQMIGNLQLTK